MKVGTLRKGRPRRWTAFCYLAPTALLLLLVVAYPIIQSFYTSFHATKYLKVGEGVGVRNYLFLFRDDVIRRDLLISLKYVTGSLFGAVPIGLLLAILLNQNLPLLGVFRTICALPWVISQTVSAYLFIWLLNPTFGPFRPLFEFIGHPQLHLRASELLALPTLVGVNIWMSYPFAMILFMAGLQTIPKTLYEAAQIDGASMLQEFSYITLPILMNTVAAVCVMLTLYYFAMVTLVLIFTGGGPAGTTETLSLRTFNLAFSYWRLGSASALGFIIFLLNAVFTVVYVRVLHREPEL